MKMFVKVTLIIAAILIGLGIITLALSYFLGVQKNAGNFETKERKYDVSDTFSSLDIDCIQSKLIICESDDGLCHVTCIETDNITHTVGVAGGVLSIKQNDTRTWFQRLWFFNDLDISLTVYLPLGSYDELTVKNTSGGVSAEGGFDFANAVIANVSGRVSLKADVKANATISNTSGSISVSGIHGQNVTITSVSGGITLSDIHANKVLRIGQTSGSTELSDISCGTLNIKTVSGKTELKNTIAETSMRIDGVSGKVHLDGCDSADIYIEVVSGKVEAVLLSGKVFTTHTTSGSINVPENSTDSGKCEIKTISGGIEVEIKD